MRSRLLQSTQFRLALLYAGLFCMSMVLLLTFIYFAIVREMEGQIKHRITAQINQAVIQYKAHGLEELKRQLSDFLEEEDEGVAIVLLTDVQGKELAGNMENWPEDVEYEDKWLTFDIESAHGEENAHVLARDAVLSGGYHLLMGYSLRGPNRMKQIVLDVVTLSVALAFIFTVLGSALFSRVIKRRLERVNQICAQVMAGNLDVSVPVTGGRDEFDHLAGNVNAMLRRIAELVRGLQQTSDNIAHDLRTPLNRHRIRLEGLMNHPPQPSGWQEPLKAGIEEIDGLVETLNSILRISQAQSGVASSHIAEFDLSASVTDVVDFYAEFAEQKHIEVRQEIAAGIVMTGDKPLLTQAVANLIDNAVKYTPAGGVIAIVLRQENGVIECIVADTGPGIPEAYYDKVKERFFRMEASRTSPGTGLGLSLADAVARLHRGTLVFEDNHPGLKVTLRLQEAKTA